VSPPPSRIDLSHVDAWVFDLDDTLYPPEQGVMALVQGRINAFMIDAVGETARWTSARIKAIRLLLDQTAATMRERAPRIYSRELAELVFAQPYCRIGNLVEAGIAQRQSASTYLKTLVSIGLLEERKAGRERLFVNPALLTLLMQD
jgi:hypothetical protein